MPGRVAIIVSFLAVFFAVAWAPAAPVFMDSRTLSAATGDSLYCGGQQPGPCPGRPGWVVGTASERGDSPEALCQGQVPGVCPYPR
jgi:hypothetical protein